ncbi:hypothetical protein BDP27DRAFT_1523105 [Rhodocollybia butyracea]|uniref:Uncharacterized protein n=1 Tax=Rhodocollybia butyracea TaxID=206335 RepID=A0A9P5P679_9AGAR|nr:hypothetical protein BDP27DRAFT_1523105 [Rhodocollybia butyracea]
MEASVKDNYLPSGCYAIVNVLYLNCPTVAKPDDANTSLVANPYHDRTWWVTRLPNRAYTLEHIDNAGCFAATHDLRQDAMPRLYWGFGSDSQTAIVELDGDPEHHNNWWTFESQSTSEAADIAAEPATVEVAPAYVKAANNSHLASVWAFILMADICLKSNAQELPQSRPEVPPVQAGKKVSAEHLSEVVNNKPHLDLPKLPTKVAPIQTEKEANAKHLPQVAPCWEEKFEQESEGEDWQQSDIASSGYFREMLPPSGRRVWQGKSSSSMELPTTGERLRAWPQPLPELPSIRMGTNEARIQQLRQMTARLQGELEQKSESKDWQQSDMASSGFFEEMLGPTGRRVQSRSSSLMDSPFTGKHLPFLKALSPITIDAWSDWPSSAEPEFWFDGVTIYGETFGIPGSFGSNDNVNHVWGRDEPKARSPGQELWEERRAGARLSRSPSPWTSRGVRQCIPVLGIEIPPTTIIYNMILLNFPFWEPKQPELTKSRQTCHCQVSYVVQDDARATMELVRKKVENGREFKRSKRIGRVVKNVLNDTDHGDQSWKYVDDARECMGVRLILEKAGVRKTYRIITQEFEGIFRLLLFVRGKLPGGNTDYETKFKPATQYFVARRDSSWTDVSVIRIPLVTCHRTPPHAHDMSRHRHIRRARNNASHRAPNSRPSPILADLFEQVGLDLVHGWLVDPLNPER